MTVDRKQKKRIRAHQKATGLGYMAAMNDLETQEELENLKRMGAKMSEARIENWSVGSGPIPPDDPWKAPENQAQIVPTGRGIVTGHPDFKDGTSIDVSIGDIDGLELTGRDKKKFTLGAPQPEYIAWLKSENIPFDPEHPIKKVDKLNPKVGPRQS